MTLENARILIVDDEPEFLDTLMKRMHRRGIACTGKTCPESALAHLENSPTDILVLDVRMPGIQGPDLLREAKRINPATQVILLTGHACVSTALECMTRGAFDYLTKPVELDRLIFRMEDAWESICTKQRCFGQACLEQKDQLKDADTKER